VEILSVGGQTESWWEIWGFHGN